MTVKQQQTVHSNLVRLWQKTIKIPSKQCQTEFYTSFALYELELESRRSCKIEERFSIIFSSLIIFKEFGTAWGHKLSVNLNNLIKKTVLSLLLF